ncbi:ankyrin repeat domain-containing protein 50-like isoform X2 [Haliotis rubra]|uniref:ankyrin repeat domain-containing protein 50-like isoform X2 n=1 Tax=Haliotis rubra TaxID=36100 RepID=UPI001EE5D19E|nr:ankyrin repeat domain-containing protein 50-like isoform X2 [Haliotis rubra]
MWIYGSIVFLCYLTVQGEEECAPGKYGDGCSQNCSKNCKPLPNGIVLCHKETGECFEGCKAGVYGDQCNEPCSKNCQGDICNQHNGHCTLGCRENHIGDFCETSQEIYTVHQGTTYSSHTTVTTGVSPTSSSQVIIPVVVAVLVLILILVGAVAIIIWRRKKKKKKKKKSQRDPGGEEGFPLAPVSETQIECGRREAGSNQGDSAWSEGIALIPGSSQESDVHATPTPARGDTRADADLRDACMEGNLAKMKRILYTGRADVNCRIVGGMTPVMWAAVRRHRDGVELLVSRGADVSLVDDDGNNILHCACVGGDRKTVELVLSLDVVDINCRGLGSRTPVMVAAVRRHRDMVELLVSRGADVSLVDDDGNNILHCACVGGDRKTVELVLSLDVVDINCRGLGSRTPVMVAAVRRHRDVVEFLVSRGADVSLVDDDGNNILHWACVGGDRETVKFVLSLDGVDINSRGERSRTLVMWPALEGHMGVVVFLVSRGAEVLLVDDDGNNTLHCACMGGDRKTVEFVLSLDGVDINVRNNYGKTAADVAGGGGHLQLSDLLVSRGTQ